MPGKTELRALLRAQRQAMGDGGRSDAGDRFVSQALQWAQSLQRQAVALPLTGRTAGVPTLPAPLRIGAYLSSGTEPPTASLLRVLTDAGYQVYVPVCEAGFLLSWVLWRPDIPLHRSALAPVDEPVGERLPAAFMKEAAGILLPALAADAHGIRLGHGGGYYDRFLASLGPAGQRPRTAAMVYDHELLPAGAIGREPWDAPVDGVLTPRRCASTAAGRT